MQKINFLTFSTIFWHKTVQMMANTGGFFLEVNQQKSPCKTFKS
jgi:hypothetical protein